ncbi:NUDIX hydrolase [Mycobacterium paraintracellulare]|uniref:NUDIX hydrolase n=1 Tax=Mycobacterium paraintracellulare TaxID=1138383 RepID=UPI0019267AD9|nr:CoA pyrophosphatase [Mycobacterium paraintracellulare]
MAVVVAGDRGRPGVWLVRRPAHMREYPGQFALPGGKVEAGEHPVAAALRELREELGIRLDAEQLMGRLDDYVTSTRYLITPVVCWAGQNSGIKPDPGEVACAHFVSLDELALASERVVIPDHDWRLIQLPLRHAVLHAPAAAVLHQFAEVVLANRQTRLHDYDTLTRKHSAHEGS